MAGELLASLADVNVHLASSSQVLDALNADLQIDASRLIKAQLTGVFQPAVLVGWGSPDTTPPIIRAIASRLIAAKWLSRQTSESHITEIPAYAQELYNEALMQIAGIKNGSIIVIGIDGNPIVEVDDLDLGESDYYPNLSGPPPMFTVGRIWS